MNTVDPKVGESAPKNKGNAGKGRTKGVPNITTQAIKDMLLASLDNVGGQDYFQRQAEENPNAYMALIGKIIPASPSPETANPFTLPIIAPLLK